MRYFVVLREWNSRKQAAEVTARIGEPRTLDEALDVADRLNKNNGFTFGGFGKYYATEREVVS